MTSDVTMLHCWAKFSNGLVHWSIVVIRAKNYETVSKFVKVMPRVLWPFFPGHGVSRQTRARRSCKTTAVVPPSDQTFIRPLRRWSSSQFSARRIWTINIALGRKDWLWYAVMRRRDVKFHEIFSAWKFHWNFHIEIFRKFHCLKFRHIVGYIYTS